MNWKEFMQLFGLGAASLLASTCLGGCSAASGSDSTPVPVANGVNTTLDLTAASNAPFNDASMGYVCADSRAIVVTKTTAGAYLAFQSPCPRQGTAMYCNQSEARFICPNHNAIFNLSGGVVSDPVSSGLRQHTVAHSGNILTINA